MWFVVEPMVPFRSVEVTTVRGERKVLLHESDWGIPAEEPVLGPGEVHIWRIRLNVPQEMAIAAATLLNKAERAKAGRFRRLADRRRYIAAHAKVRQILGLYAGCEPEEIGFQFNDFGKPSLSNNGQAREIRFNLAHSGEVGLMCVSRGRDVGVDVELVRPEFAGLDVAKKFFSPYEVEQLMAQPAPSRTAAFFRCWTFKEAFIKAKGRGLSIPLDSFDVALAPRFGSALLSSRDDPGDVHRWHIRELSVQEGYAAAVAVEGYPWTLIS
ncbi:MAG: 4'-phosphopantetheinyl transferase superfamily protein [Bacteroidota bacterium]